MERVDIDPYNARTEGNRGRLSVLSPHSVVFPGEDIAVGVQHRNDHKLELVYKSSNLFVVAVSKDELLGNVRDDGGSNPLYLRKRKKK